MFYVEHGYIIFDMPVMRFWWVHIYRFYSIIIYIKGNGKPRTLKRGKRNDNNRNNDNSARISYQT